MLSSTIIFLNTFSFSLCKSHLSISIEFSIIDDNTSFRNVICACPIFFHSACLDTLSLINQPIFIAQFLYDWLSLLCVIRKNPNKKSFAVIFFDFRLENSLSFDSFSNEILFSFFSIKLSFSLFPFSLFAFIT